MSEDPLISALREMMAARPKLSLQGGGGSYASGPVNMFSAGGTGEVAFPLGDNYSASLGGDMAYSSGTANTPNGKVNIGQGLDVTGARGSINTPDGQKFMAEWLKRHGQDGGKPDNQYWLRYNTKF